MYATVRRYEGVSDPGKVVRCVNEFFVPMIREIEGFCPGLWLSEQEMQYVGLDIVRYVAVADAPTSGAA